MKNLDKVRAAPFFRPIIDWPVSLLVLGAIRIWGPYSRTAYLIGDLPSASRTSLYITLAAVAGALLGFFITAISILLSLLATPSPRLKLLFGDGRADFMVPTFFAAIRAAGLLTILSVILLLVDNRPQISSWWCAILLLVSVVICARTLRLIWLLRKLTKVASAEASKTT